MFIQWPNGILNVGFCPSRFSYCLELYWGRRDLIGDQLGEFEGRFADAVIIEFALVCDVVDWGPLKAALRAFPWKIVRYKYRRA